MWDARRPSLHRNLCAKHLVGFLTRSLLAKLDICNFYLPRNSCQNQPAKRPNRISRSVSHAPRLTKTTRRSRASRRGKRGSMITPQDEKRASPIHGEAAEKDAPQVEAPLAEPVPPAEEPPRAPCRGVRREIPPSGTCHASLRDAAPIESKRPVDVSSELGTAWAPHPSARRPANNPTAACRAQPEGPRRCPRRLCRRPAPWRPFRRRRP